MASSHHRAMELQDVRELRNALMRIHTEYTESPALKLTGAQARRLCELPDPLCQAALSTLVATGFLVRSHDGSFHKRESLAPELELVQARIQTM